jgi:hydrogenase maturation protease
LKKTLLLGFGNPDRQDDGVAWHVLHALAERLGIPAPSSYEQDFQAGGNPEFLFVLQLTPEMAEEIAGYERVCFVDAHTGNIDRPLNFVPLTVEFQQSPFTHHLTPQSLLSICQAVTGRTPEAMLLSVRGYEFEFDRQLSDRTASLLQEALILLEKWLGSS